MAETQHLLIDVLSMLLPTAYQVGILILYQVGSAFKCTGPELIRPQAQHRRLSLANASPLKEKDQV